MSNRVSSKTDDLPFHFQSLDSLPDVVKDVFDKSRAHLEHVVQHIATGRISDFLNLDVHISAPESYPAWRNYKDF